MLKDKDDDRYFEIKNGDEIEIIPRNQIIKKYIR